MTNPAASSRQRSERMISLLEILHRRGLVPLTVLADELGASAATIRRDVALLAEQGLVERTHGSARPSQASRELPMRLRDGHNLAAKKLIAKAVSSAIPAGRHAVGLTGGTTAAEVMRALRHRGDLTIITNSLSIGMEAAELDMGRVLIVGGVLRASSLELVGSLAEQTLGLVSIETAIVGADGLSVARGLTTHDEIEARTNRALIERAHRVIVACDSSKIGHDVAATMSGLDRVDLLVTDSRIDGAQLASLRAAGVEVFVVQLPA